MEINKSNYRLTGLSRVLLLISLLLPALVPGTVNAANQGDSSPLPIQGTAEQTQLNIASDALAVNAAPVITVWYGTSQSFGILGNPQRFVNILGNASDPDNDAITLSYKLNGSSTAVPLSIGPDSLRLVKKGDFNADILITSLNPGPNNLDIIANDGTNTTTTTINIQYTANTIWPSVYTVDWSQAPSIPAVSQIVDGKWVKSANGVTPEETGYDRVIAIGDMTWTNYIVTVPVTILQPTGGGVYTDGGVGIILRWQGHAGSNSTEQPLTDWTQIGAYGYYRYRSTGPHYAMRLAGEEPTTKSVVLNYNTPYYFKMQVEGFPGKYSLKVWQLGTPEPAAWDIERTDGTTDMHSGSFLLVAHLVKATFGNVIACPTSQTYPLNVTTTGNGTVTLEPQKSTYQCGDVVKMTAKPGTSATFTGWAGDASGSGISTLVMIDGAKTVTANFSTTTGDLNQKTYLPNLIKR